MTEANVRNKFVCLLALLFPAGACFAGQSKYSSLPGFIAGEVIAGSSSPAGVTVDGDFIQHEKLSDDVQAYSFALDKNGLAHIFYYSGHEFKYAKWTGLSWSTQTIDSTDGFVPNAPSSIALDENNYPHIAYCNETQFALKYARWTGISWSTATVERNEGSYTLATGFYPSIGLDKNNNPHITYLDEQTGRLRYAKWTGKTWAISTVNSDQNINGPMAFDDKGYPHISYCVYERKAIGYAKWTGVSWSTKTVEPDGDVTGIVSLIIGKNGYPHIFYYEVIKDPVIELANTGGGQWAFYKLKHAKWNGKAWKIEDVPLNGHLSPHCSATLDKNDYPHIAYVNRENNILTYAKWTGKTWETSVIGPAIGRGAVSLALDGKGAAHIVYYSGNEELLWIHKSKNQ